MSQQRGYGQFCPVAKGAEIFAERWTPLVIRELLCGSHRFNDLRRGVPKMSSSVLSQRLKELEWAGVVERHRAKGERSWGYFLTDAGEALRPIVEALGAWGHEYMRSQMGRNELDEGLLMWDIRRGVNVELMPAGRVVIYFELSGLPSNRKYWWLVKDRGEVDLCNEDPGFDVDLAVMTDLRTMTRVWMGDVDVREAIAAGKLELKGSSSLRRSFRRWIGLSLFAHVQPHKG